MEVRIWGTRGSYPVAHAEMLRYGGNTTCVEVCVGATRVVLDAGTGLRNLGAAIVHEPDPAQLTLLLTHTHWDHIIGFPFFEPLYKPHVHIDVYGLRRTESSLQATFANTLGDPLLPLSFSDLQATLDFHEIGHDDCFMIGHDVRVTAARTNHPYRALGYRIESAEGVLVFIPDTGPFHTVLFRDERVSWNGTPNAVSGTDSQELTQMREAIIQLASGADWLIYDAQFTDAQYMRFPHWGHSTPAQALEIASAAGVAELLLFHHDPHRTDSEVDAMVAEQQLGAPGAMRVRGAREGMVLKRGHRS